MKRQRKTVDKQKKRFEHYMFGELKTVVIGALISLASPVAHAVNYELNVNSVIREIIFNSGSISADNQAVLDEMGVALGASLSATYILDGAVEPFIYFDLGEKHVSYDAIIHAEMSISGMNYELDAVASTYYLNNDLTGNVDLVGIHTDTILAFPHGDIFTSLSSQLYDETGSAISNIDLDPSVFTSLDLWESFDAGQRTGMFLTVRFQDLEVARIYAEYSMTSLQAVPLPGGALLLISALGMLGFANCRVATCRAAKPAR